ncbi:MAG: hypothetical protein ACI4PC_05060 [Oscillospiraceae bacterium]
MSKIWKVVGLIALVLVVIGAVLAAVGFLTGASTDRMIELIFGGRETFELILQVLKDELASIF